MTRPRITDNERQFREWFGKTLSTPEAAAAGRAFELVLAAEVRRNELGLSYTEVARRMGVSKAYVSKLFSGNENSTLLSLCKLAEALELTLEVSFTPPLQVSTAAKKSRAA